MIVRKFIASFLFALLSFIYAEKFLHTHERTVPVSEQKGITLNSNSSVCSICDFQLAKNSDLPPLICLQLPSVTVVNEFVFSPSFYNYSFFGSSTDRGPPSLA
jgi:hypothetical protein